MILDQGRIFQKLDSSSFSRILLQQRFAGSLVYFQFSQYIGFLTLAHPQIMSEWSQKLTENTCHLIEILNFSDIPAVLRSLVSSLRKVKVGLQVMYKDLVFEEIGGMQFTNLSPTMQVLFKSFSFQEKEESQKITDYYKYVGFYYSNVYIDGFLIITRLNLKLDGSIQDKLELVYVLRTCSRINR